MQILIHYQGWSRSPP